MIFIANGCYNKYMKTNKKGSATIMLIVIILVVIAVGTYFYMQNNKAPVVSEGEPISAVIFEDGFESN